MNSVLVIGAGGHAKVAVDALLSSGFTGRVEIRDDDVQLSGRTVLGYNVMGPVHFDNKVGYQFHIAVGNNDARRTIFLAALAAGLNALTIRHPNASISMACSVASGVLVAAMARIAPCACVGKGTIVNHGAIVDHDCQVGDFVHLAPGAVLGGGVTIADSVLVGARSIILPGKVIGARATIGAGAVVTKDVAPGDTVVGAPARSISKDV